MEGGCACCGTLHDGTTNCPGVVPATGPERRGACVRVRTDHGFETIRVLVARAPGGWRARVLSEPNVLWTVGGGRTTLKFLGDSPEEVENRAVEYIREHLGRRRAGGPADAVPRPSPSPAPSARRPACCATAGRKRVRLPVRFGAERATSLGSTDNLSPDGMFIASPSPLGEGTPLEIRVEALGAGVRVLGLVMWVRRRPEHGRPAGMGVRLLSPPPAYGRFVSSLR